MIYFTIFTTGLAFIFNKSRKIRLNRFEKEFSTISSINDKVLSKIRKVNYGIKEINYVNNTKFTKADINRLNTHKENMLRDIDKLQAKINKLKPDYDKLKAIEAAALRKKRQKEEEEARARRRRNASYAASSSSYGSSSSYSSGSSWSGGGGGFSGGGSSGSW